MCTKTQLRIKIVNAHIHYDRLARLVEFQTCRFERDLKGAVTYPPTKMKALNGHFYLLYV